MLRWHNTDHLESPIVASLKYVFGAIGERRPSAAGGTCDLVLGV
jgi:hypothetical protein